MFLAQTLSLACLVFLSLLPDTQQLRGFSIVQLNCTPNAVLCKDPICSLISTAEEPLKFTISFGCTLLKDVPKLMGRVTTTSKNRKIGRGSVIKAELDFCKLSNVASNSVLTTFVPKIAEQLSTVFHDCPYTGSFMVENVEIDGTKMPLIPGVTDTQTDVVFMRGRFQPIITVSLYGHIDFE